MPASVTRRQVLRWGLVGGVAVALPGGLLGCGEGNEAFAPLTATPTPAPPGFLTAEEADVVAAIVARIVPTDDQPGAVEAGAPAYIERLLATVPDAGNPGVVFAGGPFSGRTPFPDPQTGTPSATFPPDQFAQFLPLTRLQLMSWRVTLLGSAAVPGADFNDGVLPPVVGIRDQYRSGIAALQTKSRASFNADFSALTPAQQDSVLASSELSSFVTLITDHTLEGMFCAPEYGGNTDRIGWNLIRYDGDSQPLGYSIFDETAMRYRERADKPTSAADPDETFSGVDPQTQQFLSVLVRVAGGGPHFP